jgi:hypothetical protein
MGKNTQHRILFYIFFNRFDETFDLLLPEDTDRSSTYLLFTVKDKGVMGEGIFLGESILPLRKILRDGENADLKVTKLFCQWNNFFFIFIDFRLI